MELGCLCNGLWSRAARAMECIALIALLKSNVNSYGPCETVEPVLDMILVCCSELDIIILSLSRTSSVIWSLFDDFIMCGT